MTVRLINPSHLSFGVGVITPRWLFVLPGLVRRTASKGQRQFISSGDVASFRTLGRRLLGPELDEVGGWTWG